MLEILKRLSVKCGALVIYETTAATPLVVDSKTNIEKAIDEWNHRIQERYTESPPDTRGLANEIADHLKTVTLIGLLRQLYEIGISELTFAKSIGISTQHLLSVKSSELTDNPSPELKAIKLACLWILENYGEG
jgi:hypothetical protein